MQGFICMKQFLDEAQYLTFILYGKLSQNMSALHRKQLILPLISNIPWFRTLIMAIPNAGFAHELISTTYR